MSLPSSPARRPSEPTRDKPQVERAEHANLDRRPGAHLHPSARRAAPCGPASAVQPSCRVDGPAGPK